MYLSLLRSKYRECVFNWRKLVHEGEILLEQRLVSSCDLGAFYRHVNRNIANRSSIGTITADNGQLLVDDDSKANAFTILRQSVLLMMALYRRAIIYIYPIH